MNTVEIKTILHQEIEHSDERLLKMIYAIIQEYNDEGNSDDKRMQLILEERNKYLKSQGTSYTWAEVRNMALNKSQRPDAV